MNQNCLQELPAYTLFKVSELGIVCTPINHIDSIIRASMSACVDNEEPITGNDTLERILEKSEQVDDSMDLGGRSSVSVDHLSTSISIERFIEVMQQLANANILYSCTQKSIRGAYNYLLANNEIVYGRDLMEFANALKDRNRQLLLQEIDYYREIFEACKHKGMLALRGCDFNDMISNCPSQVLLSRIFKDNVEQYQFLSLEKIGNTIRSIESAVQESNEEDLAELTNSNIKVGMSTIIEEDVQPSWVVSSNSLKELLIRYFLSVKQAIEVIKRYVNDPMALDICYRHEANFEKDEARILEESESICQDKMKFQGELRSAERELRVQLAECEEIRRVCEHQNERNDILADKLSQKQKQLRMFQVRNRQMEKDNQELRVQCNQLTNSVADHLEQLNQKKEELRSVYKQYNSEAQLTQLDLQAKALEESRKIFQARTLKQQLDDASAKISRLVKQKEIYMLRIMEMEENQQTYRGRCEQLEREVADLRENFRKNANQLAGLDGLRMSYLFSFKSKITAMAESGIKLQENNKHQQQSRLRSTISGKQPTEIVIKQPKSCIQSRVSKGQQLPTGNGSQFQQSILKGQQYLSKVSQEIQQLRIKVPEKISINTMKEALKNRSKQAQERTITVMQSNKLGEYGQQRLQKVQKEQACQASESQDRFNYPNKEGTSNVKRNRMAWSPQSGSEQIHFLAEENGNSSGKGQQALSHKQQLPASSRDDIRPKLEMKSIVEGFPTEMPLEIKDAFRKKAGDLGHVGHGQVERVEQEDDNSDIRTQSYVNLDEETEREIISALEEEAAFKDSKGKTKRSFYFMAPASILTKEGGKFDKIILVLRNHFCYLDTKSRLEKFLPFKDIACIKFCETNEHAFSVHVNRRSILKRSQHITNDTVFVVKQRQELIKFLAKNCQEALKAGPSKVLLQKEANIWLKNKSNYHWLLSTYEDYFNPYTIAMSTCPLLFAVGVKEKGFMAKTYLGLMAIQPIGLLIFQEDKDKLENLLYFLPLVTRMRITSVQKEGRQVPTILVSYEDNDRIFKVSTNSLGEYRRLLQSINYQRKANQTEKKFRLHTNDMLLEVFKHKRQVVHSVYDKML